MYDNLRNFINWIIQNRMDKERALQNINEDDKIIIFLSHIINFNA